MAWVRTVPEGEAQGELRAAYDRVRAQRGVVANVAQASGVLPAVMERHIEFYVSLMFGPHKLSRARRELLAVEVSRLNACAYCVRHHGAALARVAKDRAFAERHMRGEAQAELSEQDRALLAYARKLTRAPAEVERADIAALRAAGFDDEDIVAANHVVGYFNMVNRFVLGLGVELEPDQGADPAYKY